MNTDTFPTPSIEYEYVWMKKYVFLAFVGLDGMAFLFCVICAFGIIIYRRHLTIVNTGFSLTYVFIVGCVLMLLSVPLFGIDSNLTDKISIPKACMVRIWLFSVGYSFSVGIMIVRIIYTAFMELVREFKNYQITPFVILIFVSSMAIIDTIIVIAWRCRSPPYKEYVTKEVEYIGLRDERTTLVETCSSEKGPLLIGFLCFYKGGLLLVASIISIFKREEEQKRSWDYNQCQMGLLSVLVAGAIGLPVTLSLPYNPNRRFAVGGLVVILEVVFLMIWVKALKIFKAHKCKSGEALEFGKYLVESSRNCLPCVRPVYGCIYDVKTQGMFNHSYADLDSSFDVKDAESVREKEEDDNVEDSIGFDCKVSEDVLPDDLPSHDEYNMTPYDPDAEEEEKVEEETDDEDGDKPDGETSDEDSSSSDEEKPKENVSVTSTIAKSAVTLHLDKSTSGSRGFKESNQSIKKSNQSIKESNQRIKESNHSIKQDNQSIKEDNQKAEIQREQKNSNPTPPAESRPETAESDRRGWWKPLFGGWKKSTKPAKVAEAKNDIQPAQNNVPTTPASESNITEESESSESEKDTKRGPKRCLTPHGGSTTEYTDSSGDSDSD